MHLTSVYSFTHSLTHSLTDIMLVGLKVGPGFRGQPSQFLYLFKNTWGFTANPLLGLHMYVITFCDWLTWNDPFFNLEKYAPPGLKYGWTEFMADIETYKTVAFVLATTILPNVLSDIQVIQLCMYGMVCLGSRF